MLRSSVRTSSTASEGRVLQALDQTRLLLREVLCKARAIQRDPVRATDPDLLPESNTMGKSRIVPAASSSAALAWLRDIFAKHHASLNCRKVDNRVCRPLSAPTGGGMAPHAGDRSQRLSSWRAVSYAQNSPHRSPQSSADLHNSKSTPERTLWPRLIKSKSRQVAIVMPAAPIIQA